METLANSANKLINIMSNEGYTITQQRLYIIEALCRVKQVDNIEQFWIQLRGQFPVSIATVYTNISLLVEKGWLVKQPCGTYTLSIQ